MHQTTRSGGPMITVYPPHSLISKSQKPKWHLCAHQNSHLVVLSQITGLEWQNETQRCPESLYLLLTSVNVENPDLCYSHEKTISRNHKEFVNQL